LTDLITGQGVASIAPKQIEVKFEQGFVWVGVPGELKRVVVGDLVASNGVVHKIDGVMFPPGSGPNIFEVAQNTPDLGSLVRGVVAADLVASLSSPGPFTLFAPVDSAFAALPPGLLQQLVQPANKDKLKAILLYHVMNGKLSSFDLMQNLTKLITTGGREVLVKSEQGVQWVGAPGELKRVVAADLAASNGVVHKIDGVMLPRECPTPRPSDPLVAGNLSVPIPTVLTRVFERADAAEGNRDGKVSVAEVVIALTERKDLGPTTPFYRCVESLVAEKDADFDGQISVPQELPGFVAAIQAQFSYQIAMHLRSDASGGR